VNSDPFYQFGVPATRPDASAVASQQFPTAHGTIGPATPHGAQPVGGLLGTLLSAGNHMDNFVRSRMQSYDADRMKSDAIKAVPLALSLFAAPELSAAAEAAPEAEAGAALASEGPAEATRRAVMQQYNARARVTGNGPSLLELGHPQAEATRRAALAQLNARANAPDVLSNLQTTGFANIPMSPESVMLPASGAGRAGSTAAAVARAKQIVGPETLKRMAQDELARRGGTSAEASMASMEQVARRLASHQP
jgi:hypothetical protein